MALLGKAAMVLSFDVVPDAISEHDDWHTHEHLPERLSIPGFLRGSRWVALSGQPRYFVMYEVEELGTLASAAYLERLNHPTPWTAKMMTHYRGMARAFCNVTRSFGLGIGHVGLLIRFRPGPGKEIALREWLEKELPALPAKAGLASVHLFEAGLAPQITNEQRIRGKDATLDFALLVTGYGAESVETLTKADLGEQEFERHGAAGISSGIYQRVYSLTDRELSTPGAKR